MRITVFTPTYNRAYIIENLYNSLKNQTFKNFEWVVVDDGSTDNTEELFSKILGDNNAFTINYIKTDNGGKHRAINRGIKCAKGELFYIVDSDDFLPDDALEIIDRVEKTLPQEEKNKFAGVCGVKAFEEKKIIGDTFKGDYLDITQLERPKYGITGDKAEVFYTELLKKYPFPEFENEKFITECVVWDKIAFDGYKLRFFNESVMICEYRDDGLSAQSSNLFHKNPKGFGLYLYQSGKYGKLFGVNKWNEYLKFYYEFRNEYSFNQIAEFLKHSPIALWIRLFGLRLFYKLYDR